MGFSCLLLPFPIFKTLVAIHGLKVEPPPPHLLSLKLFRTERYNMTLLLSMIMH